MAKFMITVRSVSGDAFGGGLGAIRYLVVPDNVVRPWLPDRELLLDRGLSITQENRLPLNAYGRCH